MRVYLSQSRHPHGKCSRDLETGRTSDAHNGLLFVLLAPPHDSMLRQTVPWFNWKSDLPPHVRTNQVMTQGCPDFTNTLTKQAFCVMLSKKQTKSKGQPFQPTHLVMYFQQTSNIIISQLINDMVHW